MEEKLNLTQEWDKTFPQSSRAEHRKVTFHNRYGITLAADLYAPKGTSGKLPAIAVCGPFGAVKEQSSGLYAQAMAERGFLTIAFDPSFTGESGGTPRYMASPDINTEDFQAAVDFLSLREDVDPERIGIIGICGWGGLALNTAAIETRIKATAVSTMYDMSRVNANGYFDAEDSEEARYGKKTALNAQRLIDYQRGEYALGGGVADPLPEEGIGLLMPLALFIGKGGKTLSTIGQVFQKHHGVVVLDGFVIVRVIPGRVVQRVVAAKPHRGGFSSLSCV